MVDVADGADDRAVGGDDGGARRVAPATSAISSRAPRTAAQVGGAAGDQLGDAERQVEALAGVEPRVAHRLVAVVEVGVGDVVGAAEALGDVLAGELDVDAARPRALGPVGPDEAGDLAARCRRSGGSCGRSARVNVLPCIGSHAHTTGWPASRDGAQQRPQPLLDVVGAHAADQRQPAGDAVPG